MQFHKLLSALTLSFCYFTAASQTPYWQQRVDHRISVNLNDMAKTLDGTSVIIYHNNSPDTLAYIWFHIWPNAYKNDRTAFSDQMLQNGSTEFYFSNERQRGYMNRLQFYVGGLNALMEDHPQHQDIIKLLLPSPLSPGDSAVINTSFHVKLPYNFSRGGFIDSAFQVTQWFPKPAVYDWKGWHPMPYLDQGEFYSEFGAYDVRVTVPVSYLVAATGVLIAELKSIDSTTYQFQQADIHDFAWFAAKDYVLLKDTITLEGRTIDVQVYCVKTNESRWKNAPAFTKAAIAAKAALVGTYPYDIVTVVERPGKSDNSGMEYPTITLISLPGDDRALEDVIHHEVGHNWFQGILANNERDHPWLDEGFNTYYDLRYRKDRLKNTAENHKGFPQNRIPEDGLGVLLGALMKEKRDQPIETKSQELSRLNSGAIAYYKTAVWLQRLESIVGKVTFDSIMHSYYQQWHFKHPYPEDFKKVAVDVSEQNLDSLFALLHSKGNIAPAAKKSIKISSFFDFRETERYQYLFLSPAIGYNYYDKFMAGAVIHNYTLPPQNFEFVFAPLYATGSKELNGIGRLSYTHYENNGKKLEASLAAAKFSVDEYTDSTGTNNYQSFTKLVPSLKFVFGNKSPRSTMLKFLQWKTYFITETGLSFFRDTIQQLDIISYPRNKRIVNQLQFVVGNNRALYPYQAILLAEQGRDFIRLGLTSDYFFNYAKAGGLSVRLFAGKFFYTSDQTFTKQYETDRYHLNLSGPKGYEDYTYSNYFSGRNEFEGFSNRQIMRRDGFFKVKTDLLSDKIGKTDDWLAALNFKTTIPKQVNPLEILPLKIPLSVFVDLGTYADAFNNRAGTGRFLYDAGFQLSIFRNVLNVYFPVLYSKQYRDYFKSTIGDKIFKKNISFSIDIQNLALHKLLAGFGL